VHAHQNALAVGHVAVGDGDVLVGIDVVPVPVHLPRAVRRRQARLGDPVHEALGAQPVRDQLRHRDERQAVLARERLELRTLRRGAVLVEDLADDARRIDVRQPREVHGGLRVADALQHAAVACAEGKDVAAVTEVARNGRGIDEDLDGRRPVLRADPRRHTEPRAGVDAHGVGGAILVRVALGHRRQPELIDALSGERDADQAAGALDHEGDQLRRHQRCSANEVAFVLAILVVGDDDQLAGGEVGDRLFYGGEWHGSQ
jgi:hypothetical protein